MRILSSSLFLIFFLASGILPPAWAADAQPLRVALLLEGSAGDRGWNDALISGLERARQQLGVQADVLYGPEGDVQALNALIQAAAQNYALVLVASDGLHEALRNNAANFRRTMFGCIDAGIRAPNIMSISYADEQAAFLAGVAAAMLTQQRSLPGINEAKILGWILGQDTPALRSQINGFMEGARSVDPETRLVTAVTGSFEDAAAGGAAARDLLAQGADVLVLACGKGNELALEEIKQHRAYAVGMAVNQDQRLPGHVLTSILKYPDKVIFDMIAAAHSGQFQGKKIHMRDLANGGVNITDMASFKAAAGKNMPPDMERRLRELRHELITGGIRLRSLRARTLCDCR